MRKSKGWRFCLSAVLLSTTVFSSVVSAATFKIREINNSQSNIEPYTKVGYQGAINNNGEVVINSKGHRAYYWYNGVAKELALPGDGSTAEVADINDSGTIVGDSFSRDIRRGKLFYWQNKYAAPEVLFYDHDDKGYMVGGINNSGLILGSHGTSSSRCSELERPITVRRNPSAANGTGFDIRMTGHRSSSSKCLSFRNMGAVEDDFMFGRETDGSDTIGWAAFNVEDGPISRYILPSAFGGFHKAFSHSPTNTKYLSFTNRSDSRCAIAQITQGTGNTYFYGLQGGFCTIEAMNGDYAFGSFGELNGTRSNYFVEDIVGIYNFGIDNLDPLNDFASHVRQQDSGWEIEEFIDINSNNQMLARGRLNGGPLVYVLIEETSPDSPTSPNASVSSRTVTLSWSAVSGADYYLREVSINGGAWQNERILYGTSKVYYNYARNSYRYRLKACNAQGCSSDWSPVSNSITVK